MKKALKIISVVLLVLLSVVLLAVGGVAWLYFSADVVPPAPVADTNGYSLVSRGDTLFYGPSFMTRGSHGLCEVCVEGSAAERGRAYGALLQPQLRYQEEVFVRKLHEFVPDTSYMRFLRVVLRVAMRGITDYIPDEYCREICEISRFCSDEFNWAGSPYERQVNYHAAHDIGHALQDYMLVGCSSFGCWDSASADSSLIIGRNFDFYISDDFARNKLVMVCRPDSGYQFISVSWPGMVGVLSGINSRGVSVTINASKDRLPTHVATPISILAREILQYAATADEAYAIARSRSTFVSESLLIGSAADGRAVVIEKTPELTALFRPDADHVVCTNHYQSAELCSQESNVQNLQLSDSRNRFDRIGSLISRYRPLTPAAAAAILRDPYESDEAEADSLSPLKLCNECAVNQFLAHHSVVFRPDSLLMWVSTSPWQLGEYVCYRLNPEAGAGCPPYSVLDQNNIPADPLLHSDVYGDICRYRALAQRISRAIWCGSSMPVSVLDSFRRSNPAHHQTYNLMGDYYLSRDSVGLACIFWHRALLCSPCKVSDCNDICAKIAAHE